MAHGIPSIIAVLARLNLQQKGNQGNLLLRQAVNSLLKSEQTNEEGLLFPNYTFEGQVIKGQRMAWCYGDLSCAISLFQASFALDDISLRKHALEIALRCTKFDNKEIYADSDLCHGSISCAHLFSRFYNISKLEDFRLAAIRWYSHTLEMSKIKKGFAGFEHYYGPDIGYKGSIGLLEGIAGISLSLISSISNNEPKWDRCLLLS